MIVPERCPFLSKSRRTPGVCTLLHRRPTTKQVGCSEFYDVHTLTHRYCNHSNFLGEGYLQCAIFTKKYWAKQWKRNDVLSVS